MSDHVFSSRGFTCGECAPLFDFPRLIGESEPIRRLKEAILKTARTDATVLMQGESGTGKELVAKSIHAHSPRKNNEFVAINCGAIPESLMESMLFGYEAGAFSGARRGGQKGLLEQADGGTFFLDEVAEMPAAMQVKLLRTLEEHKIRRLGGKTVRLLNVRIIAASNRNLREEVRGGRFREDLFFRLDVIPLLIPPLRERGGDVRLLVAHFLQQFGTTRGCSFRVEPDLMRRFETYAWPGNVRELKNFVEYGVCFCEEGLLTSELMAPRFALALQGVGKVPDAAKLPGASGRGIPTHAGTVPSSAETEEAARLRALLERFGRHTEGKRAVARRLGMSLATLYRKLKIAGI